MVSLSRETTHFSTSLIARGVCMLLLGAAALTWPAAAVIGAMLSAALVLTLLGGYELFIAYRTRPASRGWMIPMADGAACVGFGLLTLALPSISLNVLLLLVSVWLALYASLTGALALALWPMPKTRATLFGWTLANLLLALLAVTIPRASVSLVLQVGAGYAAVFGALQVAAGAWVRRIAVPYVEPTVHAQWSRRRVAGAPVATVRVS